MSARIRSAFGTTSPAFLISGDPAPERLREARASGYHLLHKPVLPITLRSVVSQLLREHAEAERGIETAVSHGRAVGSTLVRLGLTPVLEGSRARWGEQWPAFVAHAKATLAREAPRAADAGVTIAIEDHQDFGSEELVAMADAAGPNVGVVFDTGNPFAVGEDPVAFARRAAHRIRHVHLKDYRAQFTEEGYRLVRFAIGDGAVPFADLAQALSTHHDTLTASIEPGALEARHIRLFTADWWRGYPARDADELGIAIGRLRATRIPDGEPSATPWERGAAPHEIVDYELAQVRRSAANMKALGQETR